MVFEPRQLDDWILVRTDGTPTYNFCVVVDDVTMKITHVIRGNDHLSNTPKQVLCYQALGYPLPVFAHIPMILGRRQDAALQAPRRHLGAGVPRQGILPEAHAELPGAPRLVARRPGDLLARGADPSTSTSPTWARPARSSTATKLEWLNQQWIKTAAAGAASPSELVPFLERAGLPAPARPRLARAGGGHAQGAGPDPGRDGRGRRAFYFEPPGGLRPAVDGEVLDGRRPPSATRS